MEHQDEHITCADCGTTFVFTAQEAESFANKRLDPPKRCFECRKARRAQREGGGGGGRFDHAPRGHHGGDVNGYRSPMSDPGAARGGSRNEYRAPGFRDSRPQDPQQQNQAGPRGEYRAPGFRDDRSGGRGEYRAPTFNADRGAPRTGEYRAPGFRDDRAGRGEYRAPAFNSDRAPDRGPPRDDRGGYDSRPRDAGPPAGAPRRPFRDSRGGPGVYRGSDNSSPNRPPRPGDPRSAPRNDARPSYGRGPRPEGADRPRRDQPERPSFPITCASCGVAAQVPFKPQEGRELLCRDCYRAKKESA